jgi:hypothetical protein
MAYDEDLADRIRGALIEVDGVRERAMFGGLAFLLGGHLAVAAGSGGDLIVRCDPGETSALVERPGVQRFEMRGREMNGWLRVEPSVLAGDEDLREWVDVGLAYASSLPPN